VSDRHRFSGEVYRVGMNYCIDVPVEMGAGFAVPGARYVNVEGEAAGVRFRTRLTPRGDGAYRLFLNGEVRAAAAVGTGDRVDVTIWRDETQRDTALPGDLALALDTADGAREAFEAMTEAQRTGMLTFLDRARSDATRERYLERIVEEVRKRLA
jgi:hypothetical protein